MCLPLTLRPCVSWLNLGILTKREQSEAAALELCVTAIGSWSCSANEQSLPGQRCLPLFGFVLASACCWQGNNKMCRLIVEWLASLLCPSRNPSFSCCVTWGAFLFSFLTSSPSVRSPLSPRLCSNWQSCNPVAAVLYCLSLIGIRGCWRSPAMLNWLIGLLQSLPDVCLTNRSLWSFWK